MQCVGSVMTFLMNQILMAFSATAVAVFGVYFKLQSFVFMPIFGMNNGMVPIISYNYGARKPERVKKTIRLAVFYAECIMLVGFCIFQFLPDKLLGLFSASDAMLAIGIPALRIICPHFLLAGAGIVLSSVFQALGNGVFQPHRLRLPSAGGAHPRRMAAEPHRRGEYGLVGLHHRRGGQPSPEPRLSWPASTAPSSSRSPKSRTRLYNERNVNSMAKKLKWNLILMSLLYLGLGIFLLMRPGTALNVVCYALGGVVLACAAVQLVRYFVVERGVFQSQLTLISGSSAWRWARS